MLRGLPSARCGWGRAVACGRRFRLLVALDDPMSDALAIVVDRSIPGLRVAASWTR